MTLFKQNVYEIDQFTRICVKAATDRITEKTEQRIATGNFHLYRSKKQTDDWD